jgi:acyl-CoA reductase-like NAD-dependent aldehyde dehydrogenase
MLRAVARRAAAAHNGSAATEVRRRPLGVVATVTPWNNPIYIPLGKIAPALMFGNAVAWKPAPPALSVSERLAALIEGAGLPPGTLGVISGGRRAAQALMADPDIDAVSLTGSSPTGFAAQEICARRRIPLQAELGGNNAALVWEDADLEHAAREIAEGAFGLAGQRCTANRRVIVHRARGPELLELLERLTAALSWGDPRRADTRVGPLVSAGERDRVAGLVSRAAGAGEPIVVPHGDRAPTVDGFEGRWYPPTIVPCEDPSHEIVQEESFGPVLVVQAADHWEQAMALVNGVRQGLVAALFSSSPEPAARFLDEAEAGILKLNRSTADADVDVPFGGWKSSGVGPPEHGGFDRDFYTRPQVVYR